MEPMEMREQGPNSDCKEDDKDMQKDVPVSDTDVDVNVQNHRMEDQKPAASLTDDEEDGLEYDPDTGDVIFKKKEHESENKCSAAVGRLQTLLAESYKKNKGVIWKVIGVILLLLYLAYVIYCLQYSGLYNEPSIRLLVCTAFGVVMLVLHITQRFFEPLERALENFQSSSKHMKTRKVIRWVLYVVSTIITVTLIIVLVALKTPENLVSLAGLAVLILICYVTSYRPSMIDWHTVFWGFSLQFYFAVIILKTKPGYDIFEWLGDRVTEFLAYSNAGATFVFGDFATLNIAGGASLDVKSAQNSDGSPSTLTKIYLEDGSKLNVIGAYTIHFFVFSVLPVVVFFSAFVSVLFYLGVMNVIVKKIGRFLSFCLGTTPAESVSAAGNIFVAMTESPLLIRPYLSKMTSSELHAVMTGGFATIAGSVLGIYISFGVPADHLLSASVMSAPAALAISKLTYPEVEVPVSNYKKFKKAEKAKDGNLIQAASNGAMMSAKICGAIMVNVIAFLALLKFVNNTLTWFGDRAGVEGLTFELICSYVLFPIALFMGVAVDDCKMLAELIGIKTFTNEFIAFEKLSGLVKNRETFEAYTVNPNNTWHREDGDIYLHQMNNLKLEKGILEKRSEVIATYALCGFSNFGSMGILLGGLVALAPNRAPTMSRLIFRAMVAGNIACFFTACIAALFYEEMD